MKNIQPKTRNFLVAFALLGGAFYTLAPSPVSAQTTRRAPTPGTDLRPLDGDVKVDQDGRLIPLGNGQTKGGAFVGRGPGFGRGPRGFGGGGPRGFRGGPGGPPHGGRAMRGPGGGPEGPMAPRGPRDFEDGDGPRGQAFGPGPGRGGRGPRGGGAFGGGPRGFGGGFRGGPMRGPRDGQDKMGAFQRPDFSPGFGNPNEPMW